MWFTKKVKVTASQEMICLCVADSHVSTNNQQKLDAQFFAMRGTIVLFLFQSLIWNSEAAQFAPRQEKQLTARRPTKESGFL
jgi:hypothetical protein